MSNSFAHKMTNGALLLVCVSSPAAFSGHSWARAARLPPFGSYTSEGATWRPSASAARHEGQLTSVPALGVSEIVQDLRSRDMPVASIAEMARVERKTVYAWLDGAEVRAANEVRMRELHGGLAAWEGSYRDLRRVWNRSLSGGGSLHDLLVAETVDAASIQAGIAELRPAVDRRARQEALRHVPSTGGRNAVLDEIPVADLG